MKPTQYTAQYYKASEIFTDGEMDVIAESGDITFGQGVHSLYYFGNLVDQIEAYIEDTDTGPARIQVLVGLLPPDTLIDLES